MKKKMFKRAVSMTLTISMLASLAALPAKAEETAIPLMASRIDADKLPEGDVVYFGTASANVAEENAIYEVPIYREGDLSGEVSVDIHTVDIMAVYGEDYVLVMDDVEKTGGGKSIMEEAAEGADIKALSADESENVSIVPLEDNEVESDDDKDPLAKLKEEQTGKATRKLKDAPESDFIGSIREQLKPDLMPSLPYSAETSVTFADGEDEKMLRFRIKDDNKSEGSESFSITITKAQNAEPFSAMSLSVTIEDDEEAEKSTISFTKDSYKSKDGKAVVKVKREGAEYSVCDFAIATEDITALEGENYSAVSGTIALMPYETEKEIEIPVQGSGDFKVKLADMRGCEAGDNTETTVTIMPQKSEYTLMAASDGSMQSFQISIGGVQYTVEYEMPSDTSLYPAEGKIYDTRYSPRIEVGQYLFGNDTEHGGYFDFIYGKKGRTDNQRGEYRDEDGNRLTAGDNYMYLYVGEKNGAFGEIAISGSAKEKHLDRILTTPYQYVVPDVRFEWHHDNKPFVAGLMFWFKTAPDRNYRSIFADLAQRNLENNYKWVDTDGNGTKDKYEDGTVSVAMPLFIYRSCDSNKDYRYGKTKLYGVVCMYKYYNVTTDTTSQKLTFKVPGSSAGISQAPFQIQNVGGVQNNTTSGNSRLYYASQDDDTDNDIMLGYANASVNGHDGVYANVSGYDLTINSGKAEQIVKLSYPQDYFTYLDELLTSNDWRYQTNRDNLKVTSEMVEKEKKRVNANLLSIPNDKLFISWIDMKQQAITSRKEDNGEDFNGFYQKLLLKPVFDYKDVKVELRYAGEDKNGEGLAHFNDTDLADKKPQVMTFHAGDTLDLGVTVDSPVYHADGYEVSYDGGVSYNIIRSTTELFLEPDTDCVIRPRVVKDSGNRIEIIPDATNFDNLEIKNVIPQSDLTGDYKGRYFLDINPEAKTLEERMTPVPGNIYPITVAESEKGIKDTNKLWYAVFKEAGTQTQYAERTHYFVAKSDIADNVINITASSADEAKYNSDTSPYTDSNGKKTPNKFAITGTVTSKMKPIRQGATEPRQLPVQGYSVTAAALTSAKDSKGNIIPETVTATTDENGKFTITGLKGAGVMNNTLYLSDGSGAEKVAIASFPSGGVYSDAQYLADGSWEINMGNIELSYPADAPSVRSINYEYGKDNTGYRNTDNMIAIRDDSMTFTAVADLKGRKISKAILTIRSLNGRTTEIEAEPTETGGSVFEFKIDNLLNTVHSNDYITILLVDAEMQEIYTGDTKTKTDIPIEYPEIDTGLSFAASSSLLKPITFDVTNSPTVNIPVINSATGHGKSGNLQFTKTDWPNHTGYTYDINIMGGYTNKTIPSTEDKIKAIDKFHHDLYYGNENRRRAFEELLYNPDRITQDDIDNFYYNELNKSGNQLAGMNNSKMSIDVTIVLAFDFVYDPDKNDFKFYCGTAALGGTFNYMKTMYTVVYAVPVFIQISGTLEGNGIFSYVTENGRNALDAGTFNDFEGNIAERLDSNDLFFGVMIDGKVMAGVGMCGILDAYGYLDLRMKFDMEATEGNGGAMFTLSGGLGFDLAVISYSFEVFTGTVGVGTLKDKTDFSWGWEKYEEPSLQSLQPANNSDDEILEVKDGQVLKLHHRDMGSGTLSSFGAAENGAQLMSSLRPARPTVLLDNAPERTSPHIVPLNDDGSKKFMTFIGSGEGRTGDNRPTLFYSVYDELYTNPANGGHWTTPAAVADDGTADASPAMAKVDDKIHIFWSDASETLAEGETKDKLSKMNISGARYDILTGEMSEEQTITDDEFLNIKPQLVVDGDIMYVTYMEQSMAKVQEDKDILNIAGNYSTMAATRLNIATKTIDDEKYITIDNEDEVVDPLIFDYDTEITHLNGDSYFMSTFTIDVDEDLSTADDRELYLGIDNITQQKRWHPIKITNDSICQSSPKLTELNGELYLTWLEDGYVFNMLNVTEILHAMFCPEVREESGDTDNEETDDEDTEVYDGGFDAERIKAAYDNDNRQTAGWQRKTAQDLGLDEQEYEGSIYESLYNFDFYAARANFNGNKQIQTSLGTYIPVTDGEDIYVFYTTFGSDPKSTGLELYGVRYDMSGGSAKFRTAVQITDTNKVINELDLYMTEEGTISTVSNYYSQWIDENGKINYGSNQLVEIDFESVSSLETDSEGIRFPERIYAGDSAFLGLKVINEGLIDTMGYAVKVSEVRGGEESVFYEYTDEDGIIPAGGSVLLNIPHTVPSNADGLKIKAVVTELNVDASEPLVVEESVPYETRLIADSYTTEQRNGKFYADIVIKNNGNKPSTEQEITVSPAYGEKVYATETLKALGAGEIQELSLEITPELSDFNHAGIISVKLQSGDIEEYANLISIRPVTAEINGGAESISLNGNDDSATLQAEAAPWSSIAGDVQYTSSDSAVAYVSNDGKVTPAGNGKAVITAYYPLFGISDDIEVSVAGVTEPENPETEPTPTPAPGRSGGGGGGASSVKAAATPAPSDAPGETASPAVNPDESGNWFDDVPESAWYYEPVKYAFDNGLMSGVSDTEFAPEMDITRGMFVTVLHRMENEPEPKAETVFLDVTDGAYYAEAVAWANENGIVAGYSDTEFAPEDKITREQLAAIMYRYAGYKDYDVSAGEDTNILSYADALDISEYAAGAMRWICGEGIVSGFEDNTVRPKTNTTRAQAAAILERFIEKESALSMAEQSFEIAPLE